MLTTHEAHDGKTWYLRRSSEIVGLQPLGGVVAIRCPRGKYRTGVVSCVVSIFVAEGKDKAPLEKLLLPRMNTERLEHPMKNDCFLILFPWKMTAHIHTGRMFTTRCTVCVTRNDPRIILLSLVTPGGLQRCVICRVVEAQVGVLLSVVVANLLQVLV